MNNLLKIILILILGLMILKNSKKNQESFTSPSTTAQGPSTAVDLTKMDQYDKLKWCKKNFNNKDSDQYKNVCQPGCSDAEIVNEKNPDIKMLSEDKFISKDIIKMWKLVCDKEKKQGFWKDQDCLKQRLYDTQCRPIQPLLTSTCAYAKGSDITNDALYIKYCRPVSTDFTEDDKKKIKL